jgi:DNA-binding Lrp family transcriptional regulator
MASVALSPVDRLLIGLLQKNARTTNKELAKGAGIAESTCLDRVRSLQERGVLLGWHAAVDLPSIGRPLRALISVRLQPKTAASVRGFEREMLAAPETVSVFTVSGSDDFLVEIAVSDVEHLRQFVLDVVTSRPDVVDTRTSLVVGHERKHVIEPLPANS